jgi:hypothetical protein
VTLGLVSLALCTTGVSRARAGTGEVEGTSYGGQSSGGWICGPVTSVPYAGVAGSVRYAERERHDRKGPGMVIEGSLAAEHQVLEVADMRRTDVLGAAQVRAGASMEHLHVTAGLVGYQAIGQTMLPDGTRIYEPEVQVLPQIELGGGASSGSVAVRGVAGFGASTSTTTMRPGFYTGATVDTESGFGVDARVGGHRAGPSRVDHFTGRGDVVVRIPVTERLRVRPGGGVAVPTEGSGAPVDWEASMGMVTEL